MIKIKQGDEVIVTTGKDKGRRGTVLQIFEDERVLVEGINIAKKHTKPNPNAGIEGFRVTEDGAKERIFRSTGEAVDL